GSCTKFRWPPSPRCPFCWSPETEWTELLGAAILRSWVTYRRQYFPEFPVPYSVGLIEFEEGPRYQSLLVNCVAEELVYEMPMALTFRLVRSSADPSAAMLLPMFEPKR